MNAYRFYSFGSDYSGIVLASNLEEAKEKVLRFITEVYKKSIPDDLAFWKLEDDNDFDADYGVFER